MDDTPGSGPTARRAAPGTVAGRATGPGGAAPTGRAAKAAPATRATAAKRVGRGPKGAAGRADSAGPEVPGDHDRRPWSGERPRALYSRRIQRTNERWALPTRAVAGLLSRPELVLGALGQKEPVEREGRVLNRGVQAMIGLATRFDRGGDDRPVDPVVMRRQMRTSSRLAMPVRTDVHAWGRTVPGPEGAPPVPVRLYRQFGSGLGLGGDDRLLPAVVYYHGGGWVTGDLDTHDASCRMLAAAARCVVVAVDYRLAPEHPFPAAVDDALAAYAWVQRNAGALGVDPRQVGVMGDSAGGNLAAVVALEARAGGGPVADDVLPPVVQGLIYPALDARLDSESVRTLGEGFFLTLASMEHFRELYLPDASDWTTGRASPLLAEDHRGVAPALVVTAGFDPLRDDGSRYAEVLRTAGVEVEYRCYDDQVHGFLGMAILPDSLALATEVFESMGRLIRRPMAAGTPG